VPITRPLVASAAAQRRENRARLSGVTAGAAVPAGVGDGVTTPGQSLRPTPA
jgi:hypothetical protein